MPFNGRLKNKNNKHTCRFRGPIWLVESKDKDISEFHLSQRTVAESTSDFVVVVFAK